MSYFNNRAIDDQIREERARANILALAKKYEDNDGCDEDGFDVVGYIVTESGIRFATEEQIAEFYGMEDDLPF